MTTEKQIPTAADDSERLRKYRLTPDELRDESKLRAKIISSKAVFSYGALGANAAGIPGLGAVFVALEGVVNSVDRVQRQRWTNLVNVVHVNREFMEEQLLVDILDAAVEALEDFKKYLGEWSKMGWFESWWKRHPIAEKVDEFHQAFEEAYRLVPLAVWTNNGLSVKKLQESLQQAIESNAIANQRRIESEIYRIRMDQTLDVSDLPAYLDGEVTLLDPKVGKGNRYEIALGRWLGREIVALKFPMDFEMLDSISAPDGPVAGSGSPERVEIARKDVVHGSLSPTNVLVKTDGSTPTALIGDFSVAKIVQANDRLAVTDLRDDRAMTRYQAREVYTTGEAITPEADVFAWATTSLEILSGVRPYDKEDEPQALFDRVLTRRKGPTIEEHKSPIWESCPGLWDLLVACWNEVPHLRPRLNDILTKLNEYVQHHETGPLSPSATFILPRWILYW
ncbi:Serine/threonine-protein kinase tnni3k [Tulasnella sp. 408]|nr:Serine/threonine-protein kinase tnni3k [Tulasnella sp. 408]